MNNNYIKTTQIIEQMKKYAEAGTKPWDYQMAATDMAYQVGSLIKLIMQLNGERLRRGKTDEKLKIEIADELADILSEVLFIAHELGIDLDEAWNNMLKSDEKKIKESNER